VRCNRWKPSNLSNIKHSSARKVGHECVCPSTEGVGHSHTTHGDVQLCVRLRLYILHPRCWRFPSPPSVFLSFQFELVCSIVSVQVVLARPSILGPTGRILASSMVTVEPGLAVQLRCVQGVLVALNLSRVCELEVAVGTMMSLGGSGYICIDLIVATE